MKALRNLRSGRFAKNVAVLASGTAIGQLVTVAISPLLTRLYSPADLGRFAVFSATVSVCSVVVSLRYETAVVSAEPSDVPAVAVLAAALVAPMSLVATLAVGLAWHANTLGLGELTGQAIALVLPSLVFAGISNVLRFWFIRREEMRPISALVVVQSTVRSLAQLGLGAVKMGWLGLVVGDASGRASGVLGLARRAYRELRAGSDGYGPRRLVAAASRYRQFSTYYLLSSAIDILSQSLPVPLMAQAFGADTAGQFALVQRILAAPIALIAATFADAFHGRLAALARTEAATALPFFWRSAKSLLLLGLGPILLLVVLAPVGFTFVFGPRWSAAGTMAAVMGPWALCQFVVSPLSRAVLVYEGQRVKLFYDAFTLTLVAGTFALVHRLHLTPVTTVATLAVVQTVAYAFYFLILVTIIRRTSSATLRAS